ncbi:MAG: hypothetical protein WC497_03440 [Patescibacteria group bacterium]
MNVNKRTGHFYNYPAHHLLWLSLIIIQSIGFVLVAAVLPFISAYTLKITSTAYSQNTGHSLAILSLIVFIILALGNWSVIWGIWQLRRWPLYYFISKTILAVFLITAVLRLRVNNELLFFVVPLFGSLCYMVWAYHLLLSANAHQSK